VTIVDGNIYNSFQFHNIGKRSKRLQAPIRRGARALQILEDKIEIAKFEKEDTQWLQDVSDPKQVDSEIDAILEIKAPLLDGRGLWKFKYGRTSLSARIDDQEFMERVNNSAERFAHGDKFHVRLRTRQLQEGDRIKTEHSVSRIIARVSS
jgi:hypothetical protein